MIELVKEWTERVREFLVKIDVEATYRPETLTSGDFLEIHWVVQQAVELQEKMKEILTQRLAVALGEGGKDDDKS